MEPRRRATEDPLGATFRAMFDREIDYVCHSLRRLGIHEADLDDAAQEVFLSVHRRFDEYDPARPARPWLFSFACRYAANYRRLARHRRELLASDGAPAERAPAADDPERAVTQRRRQRALHEALEQLPLARRAVFVMFDLDGMTASEIAAALEVPVGTVYSRVQTARDELRHLLREDR